MKLDTRSQIIIIIPIIDESQLGKPSREKSAVFFNIVQKAFDPPLSFEHHVVNFLVKNPSASWQAIGPPPKSSKCQFVFGEGGAGSENLI